MFLYASWLVDVFHISASIGYRANITVNLALAMYLICFLGSLFVYIFSGFSVQKADIMVESKGSFDLTCTS